MNATKIKCLAQQINDAAQAIIALECIGDEKACGYLIGMYKDQLKMYSEALHEEINRVA